tara:strand:- start:61 stop:630 length:570 start_codon:yes stop_codon:yes gene_type:complete
MFFSIFRKEIKWYFIKKQIKDIKLLIFDVDGVLTDGYLYYDHEGNQLKRFSVKDGLGIRYLQKAGMHICLVSGGKEDAIIKRARDLDIKYIFCEVKNKREKVEFLQSNLNLTKNETLFLGDDLNDLVVRESVRLLIAPNNASKGFKKYCNAILINDGGQNAIRELAERLLKNSNLLKRIEENGFIEINK